MCGMVPKNVRHGAKNVRHGAKHVRHRKVNISFCVHEALKIKKLNANFSILGPKNAKKKQLEIFLTPL